MIDEQKPIHYVSAEIIKSYGPAGWLERYCDALMAENRKINIVSRETNKQGLIKLSIESLIPLHTIDLTYAKTYLDIGSGGGIPAIPILLANKTVDCLADKAVLVERTGKKADALSRILVSLGLRAEIVNRTFEEYTSETRFDLITMRYIKLTPKLLRAAMSALSERGLFVYYAKPDFTPLETTVCAKTIYFTLDGKDPIKSFTIFHRLQSTS